MTFGNILNIIVLLILAGVAIAALSGDNGILQRATEAKKKAQQSNDKEDITILEYQDTIKESLGEYKPVALPTTGGTAFSRANGKIDIQFLKGTTYNIGQANRPTIDTTNMVPVNWDATNSWWVVTDETDWDYSYGDTDATKKWANVMLRDVLEVDGITDEKTATIAEMKGKKVITEGSMLVWLPRYAYKITYYDESDTEKQEAQ